MSDNKASFDKHIGALDGIRAYAIIMVVWYHLWQQNWITPYISFNNTFTKYFGITDIPLAAIVRYGSGFVDILVFLSAFCNFLPYMRSVVLGEKWPNTKEFFIKRFARIAPSYYLALGVSILISVIQGDYAGNLKFGILDCISHLLFVSPFYKQSIIASPINGVLWTVEIEVIFYLIIPVIAYLFKKFTIVVYMVMLLVGALVNNILYYNFSSEIRGYVNWPLTFLVVYANGLLACYLFVYLKSVIDENNITLNFCFTIISVISLILLVKTIISVGSGEDMQLNQLSIRLIASFACAIFVVSTCLANYFYQKIFSNHFTKYVCLISYNLYLWHQYVFFKMVQWHIPHYSGKVNPAWIGDSVWQWSYTVMAVTDVIVVAFLVTYFWERPLTKRITRYLKTKNIDKEIANSTSNKYYELLAKIRFYKIIRMFSDYRNIVVMIVGLASVSIIAPVFVSYIKSGFTRTFCADASYYFGIGRALADGYRLYSDIFDIKPPGMFRLTECIYMIFGDFYFVNILGSILICIVGLLPAIYVVVLNKRRDIKIKAGLILMFLTIGSSVALYIHSRSGYSQIELFGTFFASIYIFLIADRNETKKCKNSVVYSILCGVILACAPLFKEPFAFTAFAGALLFTDTWKKFIYNIIIPYFSGLLIALAALFMLGDLEPYINIYLKYMLTDMTGGANSLKNALRIGMIVKDMWSFLPCLLCVVMLCILIVIFDIFNKQKLKNKTLYYITEFSKIIVEVLLVSWSVGLTGAYFGHHYVFAVPFYIALLFKVISIFDKYMTDKKSIKYCAGIYLICLVVLTMAFTYKKSDMYIAGNYSDDGVMRGEAEIIDSIMDELNADKYQYFGFNGDGVYVYTKHRPIGPIFAQDYTKVGRNNWQGKLTLEQLESANIVVVQDLNCGDLTEDIISILNSEFTMSIPDKIHGIKESEICQIYYRKNVFM